MCIRDRYITAVVPYYPGARQDKKKGRTREGISAGLFARMLQSAGADRVMTVEIHNDAIAGMFNPCFTNLENVFLTKHLVSWLETQKLVGEVIVSPDVGYLERARAYAEALSADLAALSKERDYSKPNQIYHSTLIGDVSGKNILLKENLYHYHRKRNKIMGNEDSPNSAEEIVEQRGIVSNQLSKDGISNESLGNDHIGVEILSVKPGELYEAISTLKRYGFNYLQCQGGYDEGPGKSLVSFYHLISLGDIQEIKEIKEIRVKVFLKRDSDLSVPSLYKIFKGSDWQERETYDMFGINYADHPNPKRLLMPEDWRGWPLRKDYIQPDFYELQDAY